MIDRDERPPGRPGGLSTDDLLDEMEDRYPVLRPQAAERNERRGHLGSQLRGARRRLGITQVELAERTGIAQSDISAYENGEGNPTAATLQRLANSLGIAITFEPDNDQAA